MAESLGRPRLWVLGIAAFLGGLVADSPGVRAQSLTDALVGAYQTNPGLAAARAQLRVVNEGVPQELGGARPSVTVAGSAGVGREFGDEDGVSHPKRLSLDLAQPLYRGGRTVAGIARAENEVLAQRARLRASEQQVLLAATTAYMDVWRDQVILDFNLNNERVLEQQLAGSRTRQASGDVTRTDVAQAASRLAGATAARQAAEGQLRTSRAIFVEVVGFAPGAGLTLPPPLPPPASLDEAVAAARTGNPEVVAAEYSERAAERTVRQAEGEFYPDVSVVGSLVRERGVSDTTEDSSGAQVVLQVRVPIYHAGVISSRVRAAKQQGGQRRLEQDLALRAAERAAEAAWEALATARVRITSLGTQVETARSSLTGVREESLGGVRTTLDVLNAEEELLQAEIRLAAARRDEVVAAYQLVSAVGRLDAQQLALPVDVYDPSVDYDAVRSRWFGTDAPGLTPAR